jgi:nucleoside-diphosphate-sugar epimerase
MHIPTVPYDRVPLSLSESNKIKTAIVCPPTVWGHGRGTGSTRSHQIYEIARLTLEHGSRTLIHPSRSPKTFWPNIHIYDLARLYLEIIESAAIELDGGKGKATWGTEGYYFAENGVHYWQDVTDRIAEEAYRQGYIKRGGDSDRVIDDKELLKAAGPALWNLGASCKSIRSKELFGWEPREKELKDEIGEIVRSEAKRVGITKWF